jgi:hypothetical protein
VLALSFSLVNQVENFSQIFNLDLLLDLLLILGKSLALLVAIFLKSFNEKLFLGISRNNLGDKLQKN